MDGHSSLLCVKVSDEEKCFSTLAIGASGVSGSPAQLMKVMLDQHHNTQHNDSQLNSLKI
jgi:hypothetical protein